VAAARAGDFDALLSVLDPDVVLRTDGGGHGPLARRRSSVPPKSSRSFGPAPRRSQPLGRLALVNGGPGVVGRTTGPGRGCGRVLGRRWAHPRDRHHRRPGEAAGLQGG
jgi:RNA polymerase sigma-70 factor (ECF subfamily)